MGSEEVARHSVLREHQDNNALVKTLLALYKNLKATKTPQEKESLQRQIKSTDGAIDKLVHELYGLSEDEIRIVEG